MGAEGRVQSTGLDPDASGADAQPSSGVIGPRPNLALVAAALRKSPTGFDFFQAVRTLERLRPDRAAPGHFADPNQEVVRFTVNPSISFPPSEIHSLDMLDDEPARMSVNFFGLTGPLGVLPHHYTLFLAERKRARDHAATDFFDMFHHRMISFFYRAWAKNHFTIGYESPGHDHFSDHLLDLIGEGLDTVGTPEDAREALPFYVGLLGPQARGAVALEQLLEDMFDIPVEVEQFIGGWYPLTVRDQCMLGEDDSPSAQLGLGAVAGDEVWDQQTRVRLRLGPMSKEQYDDFLPTGSAHAKLRWLVKYFSRDAFDFELQLILRREEVRGFRLGDDEDEAQPLGWSSWIKTGTFARDADDAVVRL